MVHFKGWCPSLAVVPKYYLRRDYEAISRLSWKSVVIVGWGVVYTTKPTIGTKHHHICYANTLLNSTYVSFPCPRDQNSIHIPLSQILS